MDNTSLIPVVDVPEILPDIEQEEIRYKPSLKWDAEIGDFARDSRGRLLGCNGEEGYQAWCLKAVQTERFQCLAYPNELGVELEDALQEDEYGEVISAIEQTIVDALMVNPRTEQVHDFEFTWDGDEVGCTFAVKGVGLDEFQIGMEVN